ncbi:MAG: hypothetical protein ACTSQY_00865 [Candidatus Odinarchaeia archaeon]
MGTYTEFHLNVKLKRDTPNEIIDMLKFMVNNEKEELAVLPSHDLFKTDRWSYIQMCQAYYFDMIPHSCVVYDDVPKTHFLSIRCCLNTNKGCIEAYRIDFVMK